MLIKVCAAVACMNLSAEWCSSLFREESEDCLELKRHNDGSPGEKYGVCIVIHVHIQ